MQENELVLRAQKGDDSAFEQLVRKYDKPVYNYCLRMCGNRDDACDLSQESFIKVYRALALFKSESRFSTWLYRLVANTCIDFLRRKKRGKEVSLTVEENDGEEVQLNIADCAEEPQQTVERKELRRDIAKALEKLSYEHKQIILLREIDGLSYMEIAQVLEISEGTVKSRLARGRKQMAGYLREYGTLSGGGTSNDTKRR